MHQKPSNLKITSEGFPEDSNLNGQRRECKAGPLVDEDDQEEEVCHGAGRRCRHLQFQIVHCFSQQFRTLNLNLSIKVNPELKANSD